MFIEFLNNLLMMNQKIGFEYNDLKDDNLIIHIDKNKKPKIILIDFGCASFPNLKFSALSDLIRIPYWNKYLLVLMRRPRNYETRKFIEIMKNDDKTHKINGDVKFILVSFMLGYRKLFKTDVVFINQNDVKIIKIGRAHV